MGGRRQKKRQQQETMGQKTVSPAYRKTEDQNRQQFPYAGLGFADKVVIQ
jgi:hypothetical protein